MHEIAIPYIKCLQRHFEQTPCVSILKYFKWQMSFLLVSSSLLGLKIRLLVEGGEYLNCFSVLFLQSVEKQR